ncbi:MAG: hypothetical protein ACKOCK_10550 [Chloroflexota bacterium]
MGNTVRLEGPVTIVGGEQHAHAARRLRESFPGLDARSGGDGQPTITLREDPNLVAGAFAITVSDGATPAIIVTGGPFSGVIYGVEELVQRMARVESQGVSIPVGERTGTPGLPYRTFWNWDHSTNWDTEQVGVQEIGVFNPYGKPPEGFLNDFKRCVDFMSRHRIAALVIYGFLRDTHGGIAASQELCRYANERGVRILPGIAISAYGGVYWEGDHEFNLATWLRKHPELAASMERPVGFQIQDLAFPLNFPRSDYTVSGCPSRPENQQWMEDAVSWLAETFDIGGLNIESGDYGVCGCALCASRRAAREDATRRDGAHEFWSHADMAEFYPRLYRAARSRRKDLWLYSELQWDNMLDREAHAPRGALPDDGIYQHTLNRTYWNRIKRELTAADVAALPTKHNVFRAQFACQWNGSNNTERYRFNGRDFAELCWKARETGVEGLTVWGEPSAFDLTVELSYRAFGRFGYDPTLTWEAFVAQEVAPLMGGTNEAQRGLAMIEDIDRERQIDDGELSKMERDATSIALAQSDDEVSRRWLSLAQRVARRRYNENNRPASVVSAAR